MRINPGKFVEVPGSQNQKGFVAIGPSVDGITEAKALAAHESDPQGAKIMITVQDHRPHLHYPLGVYSTLHLYEADVAVLEKTIKEFREKTS